VTAPRPLALSTAAKRRGRDGRQDGARAGVQLAALIPAQALGKANAELNKSGVPFDLTQLKPEQLEALVEHLDELTVEVDQPDTKVRVFCE
jgi:hypothetical protein